jgi:hypothetical protein
LKETETKINTVYKNLWDTAKTVQRKTYKFYLQIYTYL